MVSPFSSHARRGILCLRIQLQIQKCLILNCDESWQFLLILKWYIVVFLKYFKTWLDCRSWNIPRIPRLRGMGYDKRNQ